MKIFIRLSSDVVIEYTCRGARNGLARVQTHEERIHQLVLDHFHLHSSLFEVILCLEEDQKNEANPSMEQPTYYMENSNLIALIQPVQEEEEEESSSDEEIEAASASQQTRPTRRRRH
jgi:hypothetical protein